MAQPAQSLQLWLLQMLLMPAGLLLLTGHLPPLLLWEQQLVSCLCLWHDL